MKTITLHPTTPEQRHLASASKAYQAGATLVIPTESGYRLLLPFHTKPKKDNAAVVLLCRDISQASAYADIDNDAHRLLKAHLSGIDVGNETFVLPAGKHTPKAFRQKDTITIAFSRHPVVLALMGEHPLPTLALTQSADIGSLEADYYLDMGELPHYPIITTNLSQ